VTKNKSATAKFIEKDKTRGKEKGKIKREGTKGRIEAKAKHSRG